MSKPDWKYNPLMDGGISVANQEATARATETERSEDTVFARDYAAIVEALRIQWPTSTAHPVTEAIKILKSVDGVGPYENDLAFFYCNYDLPALLRALARAIELETT